MALEAIRFDRGTGSLEVLDQLALPHRSVYVRIKSTQEGFNAIQRMVVRGAPAIAIVAALSLAVELATQEEKTASNVRGFIYAKLDYLVMSRPTAVNLADAARKLKKIVEGNAASGVDLVHRYIDAAEKMLEEDVRDNRKIGSLGALWIMKAAGASAVSVLTHCNTGCGSYWAGCTILMGLRSLATAGYGTALGIIRSLYANSALVHAYCTETRPCNQGSRLSITNRPLVLEWMAKFFLAAYELVHDKIPATLIIDSMAAALLSLKSIHAVIVGADRVARNGDTANKIGTYQLAIVARHHGVKFVVAAPTTSIDIRTASGDEITIEERDPREVVCVTGPVVQHDEVDHVDVNRVCTIRTAANRIGVFNPSFDITPHDLIDAIVTEKGVAVKDPSGKFNLDVFFTV